MRNNSKEILSLPIFPELEMREIEYICNSIKEFYIENSLVTIKEIKTENKPGILNYINNINFNTKRFFYVDKFDDLSQDNNKRGYHYNINFNELLCFFHYHPSVWQLHIHFMNVSNTSTKFNSYSLPRAHLVSSVIENIKMNSNYYKMVKLEVL